MPVTAKLSKRFYDVLGEDVANELVDWFNQVDATYRSDLRELNELNFARFDAKLEQRLAQIEAKLAQRMFELRQEILGLRGDVDVGFERSRTEMKEQKAELLRWMFLFWIGTVATVALNQLL